MSDKIVCPECKSRFEKHDPAVWKCSQCGYSVVLLNGKPVFTEAPLDLNPSGKIERSPDQGTIWRRFNWKFIEATADKLPANADVLDVGAGRGDFKVLFSKHAYLGLDIYPYPEIDLAVDLNKTSPFQDGSFDLVVLANVIEHVYEHRPLMKQCAGLLKPGGRILVTVPFLLKLHQEPVDYQRYTRHALIKLAEETGLEVEQLDGYYNPLALMDEGIGNVWQYDLPKARGLLKAFAKAGIFVSQKISDMLKRSLGNGYIAPAGNDPNPNVLGYQCIFRKPEK
jgi:SAM-dependent methyltransferase